MKRYTYRAVWEPEEDLYRARCLEFPGLWSRGPTAAEAIAAMEKLIIEEVAAAAATGWEAPQSLTDRKYSGRFVVRMAPMLHANLAVEAAEQGVSLNQWVLQKLTNRPIPPGF